MIQYKSIFRRLTRKGEHSCIKILSLTIGFSVSLVLLGVVLFEKSYEHFISDVDRVYVLKTKFKKPGDNEGKFVEFPQVPGAIAPGMKAEVPGVEVATRLTPLNQDKTLYVGDDKRKLEGSIWMADECVLDIITLPVLEGNPKDVLSKPMYCMVSESIARKMGEDIIGKTFTFREAPNKKLIVGGIFKDLPKNTEFSFDILLSLNSIDQFSWDGRNNWLGNERYIGLVRLTPGVNHKALLEASDKMLANHVDMSEIADQGLEIHFIMESILKQHLSDGKVRHMVFSFQIIAMALLLISLLNYTLIVISSLVTRGKSIAVNKCYGANVKELWVNIFFETLVFLLIAVVLSIVLVLAFSKQIEHLVGIAPIYLLTSRFAVVFVLVLLLVLFFISFILSHIYSKISVLSVIRLNYLTGKTWKHFLLFIQFATSAFLMVMMSALTKQYNGMVDYYLGYNYDRVYTVNTTGMGERLWELKEELGRMPEVEQVGNSSCLFYELPSGNNLYLSDVNGQLFNIADMYYNTPELFSLLELNILEGDAFTSKSDYTDRDVMISKSCADRLLLQTGWTDGVVGKQIGITEHSISCTIQGVYQDIVYGNMGITGVDKEFVTRPSVMFYGSKTITHADRRMPMLWLKLKKEDRAAVRKINDLLNRMDPEGERSFVSYSDSIIDSYKETKKTKQMILTGAVIVLFLSLISLISYTNDEVNRRSKELAIRKINGASMKELLGLFIYDVLQLAIPSIVIGVVISLFINQKMLESFIYRFPLSWVQIIAGGLIILVIVLAFTIGNSLKIAHQNPAETLRIRE